MPKKSSKSGKGKSGSMPTDAQITAVGKELKKMPIGKIIVRHGFKFALTKDKHIVFQKK